MSHTVSQLESETEDREARGAGRHALDRAGGRRTSVLLFTTVLGGGGAEKHLLRVANNLDRERFRVSLALVKPSGEFEPSLAADVRKFHLNRREKGSTTARALQCVAPLRRLMRSERPDIVFSVIDLVNLVNVFAARGVEQSPKIVLGVQTPPTIAYDSPHPVSKLILRLIPRLYPRADHVVALSEGVATDLESLSPRTRGRVSVIHNAGVGSEVGELSREKLGAGELPRGPLVVACGRLKPLKGFAHLIEAMAEVRRSVPAHLWIVGEGDERASLERKIRRLGLDACVRLLGFRQNPFKYMAAADVFVLSSLYEGFGNVIVEAMACGAPVVATDCPYGPREIIADGESGILVEPESAHSLARGILRVLGDAELKKRLSEKGRERARDFEAKSIADRYGELFLRVSSGASARVGASAVRGAAL